MDTPVPESANREDGVRGLLRTAMFVILFLNDAATSACIDLVDALRKERRLAYGIDCLRSRLEKETRRYDKRISTIAGGYGDYLFVAADYMADVLKNDLTILRLSVRRAHNSAFTERPDLFTMVDCARLMSMASLQTFDSLFAKLSQKTPAAGGMMHLRLPNLSKLSWELHREMRKQFRENAKVEADKDVELSLRIVLKKMYDEDVVNAALDHASKITGK